MRNVNRRQFTQEASLAFLASVSVGVASCGGGGGSGGGGDDGYGPPTSGTPTTTVPAGSKAGSISANHGHAATITSAELQAGGAVSVDISGTAGHPHMVVLPAQAVQEIRDGRKVQKESTATDGHTHTVTFNVERPEEPSQY